MPRGNDTDHLEDLAREFGTAPNAEKLIQAHRARRDQALQAASMQSVDEEASEKLDVSKLKPGSGLEVLDAKVRGGKTVAVVADKLGRTHKMVLEDGKPVSENPVERDLRAVDTTREVSEDEAPASGKENDKGKGK